MKILVNDKLAVEFIGDVSVTDVAEYDDLVLGLDSEGKSCVFPDWMVLRNFSAEERGE